MKSDRTALLIRLPTKLHRRFRIYAAERGLPMSRLVEAAITRLLRQQTQDKVIEQLLEQRAREEEALRALRRQRSKGESDHD
jgi:post-segregation antitoxin (ccd killing protein)